MRVRRHVLRGEHLPGVVRQRPQRRHPQRAPPRSARLGRAVAAAEAGAGTVGARRLRPLRPGRGATQPPTAAARKVQTAGEFAIRILSKPPTRDTYFEFR